MKFVNGAGNIGTLAVRSYAMLWHASTRQPMQVLRASPDRDQRRSSIGRKSAVSLCEHDAGNCQDRDAQYTPFDRREIFTALSGGLSVSIQSTLRIAGLDSEIGMGRGSNSAYAGKTALVRLTLSGNSEILSAFRRRYQSLCLIAFHHFDSAIHSRASCCAFSICFRVISSWIRSRALRASSPYPFAPARLNHL